MYQIGTPLDKMYEGFISVLILNLMQLQLFICCLYICLQPPKLFSSRLQKAAFSNIHVMLYKPLCEKTCLLVFHHKPTLRFICADWLFCLNVLPNDYHVFVRHETGSKVAGY